MNLVCLGLYNGLCLQGLFLQRDGIAPPLYTLPPGVTSHDRPRKTLFEESSKIRTSRDIYGDYPDFQIDLKKEQEDLTSHDRIALQFPFY